MFVVLLTIGKWWRIFINSNNHKNIIAVEYCLYIYWNGTKTKIFTGGEFSISFYLGVLNSDIYRCCGFYYNTYLFVCGQVYKVKK